MAGRQRPHAVERGHRLARDHHEPIMEAELLVRVICDSTLNPDRRLPMDTPLPGGPLDRATVDRCVTRLREAGEAWVAARPGDLVELTWPHGR